jgi:hypothetical protein
MLSSLCIIIVTARVELFSGAVTGTATGEGSSLMTNFFSTSRGRTLSEIVGFDCFLGAVVLLNLGQLLVGFAEIRIAGADMIEQALRNDSSPAAVG